MTRKSNRAFGSDDRPMNVPCPEKLEQESALDHEGTEESEEAAIAQSVVDRESKVEHPTQKRELQTDDDTDEGLAVARLMT